MPRYTRSMSKFFKIKNTPVKTEGCTHVKHHTKNYGTCMHSYCHVNRSLIIFCNHMSALNVLLNSYPFFTNWNVRCLWHLQQTPWTQNITQKGTAVFFFQPTLTKRLIFTYEILFFKYYATKIINIPITVTTFPHYMTSSSNP